MTRFNKEDFTWDGMYLMYRGAHTKSVNMEVANPNCHPSWHGRVKPEFIARFKYGSKPWKSWVNYLVKTTTVEEYIKLSQETSPVEAMKTLGFIPRKRRV
jgi:hypothetical protein